MSLIQHVANEEVTFQHEWQVDRVYLRNNTICEKIVSINLYKENYI